MPQPITPAKQLERGADEMTACCIRLTNKELAKAKRDAHRRELTLSEHVRLLIEAFRK